MAKKLWVGLDVGVETTSVCVVDDAGKVLHEAVCASEPTVLDAEIGFIKRRRFAKIAVESGVGTYVARGLRNLGYCVDVYEAGQLSTLLGLRRNKTDAGDARSIAELGRLGNSMISTVYLKTLECQSLQSRLTIRRCLVRHRVDAVNTLCRHLEHFGGRIRSPSTGRLRDKALPEFARLFGRSRATLAADFRQLLGLCEELIKRQKLLDRRLARMSRANEVCARFMAIPGVGPICALSFFAAVGDPHRFRRSVDIGNYLGLAPKINRSGLTVGREPISKQGNREVRMLLVQSSMHFMRSNKADCRVRAWASAIQQRRGYARARVAVARKLAMIMLAMWKSGEPYRPTRAGPQALPAITGPAAEPAAIPAGE